MAWRKDDADDPVGRGRGLAVDPPLPPPPAKPPKPPEGRVTPCFLRHCLSAVRDVLEPELELDEPDEDEAELHPATASTAVSATAPKTTGLVSFATIRRAADRL